MAKFPMRCSICRERALSRAKVSYQTKLLHDGVEYELLLPDLDVLRCSACGNVVLPDEADRQVSAALRARVGLLMPEEIREKREYLDLSVEDLARLIGVESGMLHHWEQGVQIQSRGMDKLLRGFFDVPAYRSYLGWEAPAGAST